MYEDEATEDISLVVPEEVKRFFIRLSVFLVAAFLVVTAVAIIWSQYGYDLKDGKREGDFVRGER